MKSFRSCVSASGSHPDRRDYIAPSPPRAPGGVQSRGMPSILSGPERDGGKANVIATDFTPLHDLNL